MYVNAPRTYSPYAAAPARLAPPVAPPPPPPPPAPLPPAVGGMVRAASTDWSSVLPTPAPATPAPVAAEPVKSGSTWGAMAVLDVGNVLLHPIKTIESLFVVTKDLVALESKRNLTVATAAPAVAQYKQACADLDAAPFKSVLPFFSMILNSWAEKRFEELRPQVQGVIAQRATHQVSLEWPDGGTGRQRLDELLMLNDVAQTATTDQIVRGFMGAAHFQVKDSTAMDYFYPMGRAGDTLILRRNLPVVPGQKPVADTFKSYLNAEVQVHVDA